MLWSEPMLSTSSSWRVVWLCLRSRGLWCMHGQAGYSHASCGWAVEWLGHTELRQPYIDPVMRYNQNPSWLPELQADRLLRQRYGCSISHFVHMPAIQIGFYWHCSDQLLLGYYLHYDHRYLSSSRLLCTELELLLRASDSGLESTVSGDGMGQ